MILNKSKQTHKTKPKIKPLLQRAMAFLVAVTTALTALPLTASAIEFVGNSNGNATYSYGSGFTYGFHGQYVSWRISLYVSTSDDGTIDPATDSIVGQKGLGYIGSIFYDNFTPNISHDVYVQSNYTADIRNANIYNAADNTVKGFPYVTKVEQDHPYLKGSSSQDYQFDVTVNNRETFTPDDNYIFHSIDVPDDLPTYGSQCTGKTVENAVSNNEFTEKIIEQMNNFLGGSSGDFYYLYNKVLQAGIGAEPLTKIVESEYDLDLLLPTNPDCIVEWCLVVEPVGEYTTWNNASFWEVTLFDSVWGMYEQGYIGLNAKTTMGLDAYAVAQYNEKTKSSYESENVISYISTRVTDFEPKNYTGTKSYTDYGKLRAEYGDTNINNAASFNYDCHTECNPYCGVNVAGSDNFSYAYNPQYAASYGGISVYVTTKEESIPVYYYIYDPNNPDAKPQKVEESYTFNSSNTFYPSTDYGIPIADESTYQANLDNLEYYYDFATYHFHPSGAPSSVPDVYPYQNYLIDSQGNPDEINNPVSIETTALSTKGGTQNKPAESIHVKVVKQVDVEVIYHIYTYTYDGGDADMSLSASKLEEKVETLTVTPDVTMSSKEILLSAGSYKASTDAVALGYGTPVHTSAALTGNNVSKTAQCVDGCKDGTTLLKEELAYYYQTTPSTKILFNSTDNTAGTRQIHVKIIKTQDPPPPPPSNPDRIKSYDVTQLIYDTHDVASSSDHIKLLDSYKDK